MAATDPQTLLSAANCYDCFLPQFALMELSLLRQILLALNPNAMTDPQSLISQASCYNCFLPQYQLMVLALLSQIASNGGGSGGAGLIQCGNYGGGTPNWTPTGACGWATDSSNGAFWQYYSGAWH